MPELELESSADDSQEQEEQELQESHGGQQTRRCFELSLQDGHELHDEHELFFSDSELLEELQEGHEKSILSKEPSQLNESELSEDEPECSEEDEESEVEDRDCEDSDDSDELDSVLSESLCSITAITAEIFSSKNPEIASPGIPKLSSLALIVARTSTQTSPFIYL